MKTLQQMDEPGFCLRARLAGQWSGPWISVLPHFMSTAVSRGREVRITGLLLKGPAGGIIEQRSALPLPTAAPLSKALIHDRRKQLRGRRPGTSFPSVNYKSFNKVNRGLSYSWKPRRISCRKSPLQRVYCDKGNHIYRYRCDLCKLCLLIGFSAHRHSSERD